MVKTDGTQMSIKATEAIAEIVNQLHYGVNEGNEEVELIVFYAGDKITPLSVSKPDETTVKEQNKR